MAQSNEMETRVSHEKMISSNSEKTPSGVVPDNGLKFGSKHNPGYYKGQYARRWRGKGGRPTVNSSKEKNDKGASSSMGESPENTSDSADAGGNVPMDSPADPVNGIKRVMSSKKPSKPSNKQDNHSKKASTSDAERQASHSVQSKQEKNVNPNASGKKAKVHQELIEKELTNCHLNDSNTIFNELSYEDRLMLQSNYIEVLKKKLEKYPSAIFQCTICKVPCNTINLCRAHIRSNNHVWDLKERRLLDSITVIPPPSVDHLKALEKMVVDSVEKFGMVESERKICLSVADEISSFVADNFPGCSVTLYGSVATKLALKDSNIDLNLRTPPSINGPTTLVAICEAISEKSDICEVEKDFDEGRPSMHFIHKRTQVKCSVCLSKDETIKATEIIGKYRSIDPRVHHLAVVFRKWAKLCKVDNYKNGMWPPHAFPIFVIYYLQQCDPPVLPVLHELAGEPDDDTYLDPSELKGKWKCRNKMSLGELWLGLLKFYAVDYPHSERVVSIRMRAPLKRSVKNWIGKRTAIEDPFCVKRNVSRTIIHNSSFKYIMNCFRMTYLYYAIPQTGGGALYAYIQPVYPKLERDPEYMKRNAEISKFRLLRCRKTLYFDFSNGSESSMTEKNGDDFFGNVKDYNQKSIPKYCRETFADEAYIVAEELSRSDAILYGRHLRADQYQFLFVAETGNKLPPVICTICTMDGHPKIFCPDARLPPLPVLPPMTKEFLAHLDEFCVFVYDEYSQKSSDLTKRKEIMIEIEEYVRSFYPDVQLSLFGSSINGFGFRNSDLDICLRFKSNLTGEGIDVAEIISTLESKLRKLRSIRNVVAIPSAKVPIIKYKHIQTQIDGDISLYNTLAQHNTQLLKTYALIDDRVKVLGIVMKKFAKLCDICDASKGSLSSYAYILMVIYFLQQCTPPVLPVLQELTEVHPKPEWIEEGQNVYFYKDLDSLEKIWPEYGRNKYSVGDLWLQMLRYYTEDFNFEECVVCIRQKQKLYKFEKMWYKKPMAIEDPFDVNHNLGGALSRKMKLFIIKSLRKGRYHFGNPIATLHPAVRSWKDYFLNESSLREGAPPNNGCHICKKIGHKVRNCPERGNFAKDKRGDADHREGKNGMGFGNQHQDSRRRPPVQGNNRGQFWPKGPNNPKDDKRQPMPVYNQQQPQQLHAQARLYPQRPIQPAVWFNQQHSQWFQMQIPRLMDVGPQIPWPPGVMPGNRPSDIPNVPMSSIPTCASIESSLTKGEEKRNSAFRSADMREQMYRDPTLPLSQYMRAPPNDEERPNNHSEAQNHFGGAIPKVGQSSSPRPRYSRGPGKGAKYFAKQKP